MKNILSLLEKYVDKLEVRTYKNGQTLFFENDKCEKIGIVKEGSISIKSFFSNGKEVTYNRLEKGMMFGNNLIFSTSPYYRGDVVCVEDSEIIFVSKDQMLKILKEDEEFLEMFLAKQADFSKQLNLQIKLLSISSAKDRVLYYLTFNKGFLRFKSITNLASILFLARETLSRTLTGLVDEGTIQVKNKTIKLIVQ